MFREHMGPGPRAGALTVLACVVAIVILGALPGLAQEQPDEALLRQGQTVFQDNCAGCHQPGGVGLPGTFPPLKGNPNVQDADYVRTTVRNGKEGRIEVLGETYDGRMPAFPALPDEDLDAVIAYIQADFTLPGGDTGGDQAADLPLAGTSLPPLAGMGMLAAFLLAAAAGVYVLAPRIAGHIDRVRVPWLDAWLRAGIIVVYFVVATVVVPSLALKTETVGRLPQVAQDIVGSGLWIGGLAIGLLGLWAAHRTERI